MSPKFLSAAALALLGLAGAAQAQIVVRDAETGELRAPTPAEAAELLAPRQPVAPALTLRAAPSLRALPQGGVAAAVPESLMTYSVARIGASGKVERECVTGEDAVARAMQGRKPFAEPFKPAAATTMTTARGAKYELQ